MEKQRQMKIIPIVLFIDCAVFTTHSATWWVFGHVNQQIAIYRLFLVTDT
jgi:hypothetical protein